MVDRINKLITNKGSDPLFVVAWRSWPGAYVNIGLCHDLIKLVSNFDWRNL